MPLSPSATRDLLARLGHSPRRFLGQNFLVDGNIARAVAGERIGTMVSTEVTTSPAHDTVKEPAQ